MTEEEYHTDEEEELNNKKKRVEYNSGESKNQESKSFIEDFEEKWEGKAKNNETFVKSDNSIEPDKDLVEILKRRCNFPVKKVNK